MTWNDVVRSVSRGQTGAGSGWLGSGHRDPCSRGPRPDMTPHTSMALSVPGVAFSAKRNSLDHRDSPMKQVPSSPLCRPGE